MRQTYPAFLAASAVAVGIFGGSLLPAGNAALRVSILSLTAGTGLLAFALASNWRLCGLIALALCGVLGLSLHISDGSSPGYEELCGREVEIIGEIASPPSTMGSRVRCLVQSASVREEGKAPVPLEGLLLATLKFGRRDEEKYGFKYGNTFRGLGVLTRPPVRRNPGEFNLRRYYAANGISLLLQIPDGNSVRILDSSGGSWFKREVVHPTQSRVTGLIDTLVGGEEGELLKGLLLGERAGLSAATRQAFAVAGVAHVLAVSGSNVAVVAGAIVLLLRLLRLPRSVHPVLTAVGVLMYMVLTGSQPPVVRATIMALVFITARSRQERVDPYNVVGIAALVILLWDTRQLFDVGFQLSFMAVLALIHLFPRLRKLYGKMTPTVWWRRWCLAGLDLMALTLAATLGTLPITASVFGQVSLVGLLANVVVVPASGLAVLVGIVTVASGSLLGAAGEIYGAAAHVILKVTLSVVDLSSRVPFASIESHQFAGADALPYYSMLALSFHCTSPLVARRLFLWFVAACAAWTVLPGAGANPSNADSMRCVVLDVGQGDAIVLQLPGERTILVDTGPASASYDAGERVIVPFLSRLGITRLEALIITHTHDDHIGGLRAVLGRFPAEKIFVPGARAGRVFPGGDSLRTPISVVRPGDTLSIAGVRFYVLAPADTLAAGEENGGSALLKVVYGHVSLLLAGDLPSTVEQNVISAYGDFLRADMLKVGHHGSLTSTAPEFLAAVQPRFAAISVGRMNRHGHPSPAVLDRLEDAGVEVGRTDIDGALIYETQGDSLVRVVWQ